MSAPAISLTARQLETIAHALHVASLDCEERSAGNVDPRTADLMRGYAAGFRDLRDLIENHPTTA